MTMNGVFVIAGASGAIGRSLCHKIVTHGGTPLLVGRSLAKLQTLQDELLLLRQEQEQSREISIFNGIDFANTESTTEGMKQLAAKLKGQPIQGVAYAVGNITLKSLRACQPQDFSESYQLNVIGATSLIQSTLPGLKQGAKEFGDASVVLFSSIAASKGLAQHSVIGASKGAIEGLTKSLAAELASQKIRVNCVAPSLTGGGSAMAKPLTDNPKIATTVAAAHPLSRLGVPDDSAHAAAYLLSADSSWTTGAILPVDGGRSTVLR